MEARWGPTAGGLIGRERELRELDARLRGRRLVTLVGPGGVGKTALGRVAAEQLEADETVVLSVVDLTKVSDPAAVAGAVAGQLGFDSFDAVLAAPVDTPCLLVIDNCEHVLDQAADVVAKLLGAARERTILATSRTPLDLPGESVFTVTPLDLPAPGDDPRASPAVMLFRQRCRDAGIDTVDGDIDEVAALCRHLDGLPLAIELAAARSRTMTVAEIAARLDDTVAVLDRPHFRGDARHRSVNTTIDWSCALLPPDAALLLERLSVFSGPFSAAAARAVAADATGDFDRQIDDLIHASLVAVDTAGTEATYRLLSTVRRYARQRLDDRGATGDVFDHFVDHVVSRAIALVAELFQPWRAGLMHDLVEAYDDIAAALQWCISNDESPRRSYRLCLPLIGTVDQGRAEEITEMMRRLLARFPQQGLGGAQARAVLATGEYVTGAYQRGVDLATSTLEQHPGPDASTVGLYRVLGRARHALGDHEGSIAAFAHGARIGHALGLDDLAQELEAGAALSHADAGRTEVGLAAVTAIIEPARAAGSVTNVSWAATVRAWILLRVDPRAALDESTQALAHAKEID
ncbi:MAG TPA: hypothetical protein VL916_04440, partial [Ilumatobacteraceae bacterium]|nr:hypothetical protein [Ilumatobacteraceae bacterium]